MNRNKTFFVVLTFFIISIVPAQVNLNEYKYVVVPNKFDFLKNADEYRLNSLAQFLFQKHGFFAIMKDDPMPIDVLNNGCLILTADVLKSPGMFKTKLKVVLKNCHGKIVYASKEGVSKDKKYKVAYHEAIRMAFNSFRAINYKYVPNNNVETVQDTVGNDSNTEIQQLREEIKTLKETQQNTENTNVEDNKEVNNELSELEVTSTGEASNILYAQPIKSGFQLVNTTAKVMYTLFLSGKKEIYIVKEIDAVVYKVNGVWTIAEQTANGLIVKTLNIKF